MVALLPVATWSQTRRRSSTKTTTPAATTTKSAEAVRNGARQVAEEIKTLSHFVYLLGGVITRMDQAETSIRLNEATPAVTAQIQSDREKIRKNLADVHAGLDKLETDFRNTPDLARYAMFIQGVSASGGTAEKQAAAGHLDDAARTLLDIVNRLTDALLAIPRT